MPLYGLDAELAQKQAEKYSPEREQEARKFLETYLNLPHSSASFADWLKDGVILVQLVNKLGVSNAKANTGKLAFKQMENIGNFLTGLDQLGVRKSEQFQTVDLFEEKNMAAVVDCFFAISRVAHSKKIITDPKLLLGPKLADSHEVLFTEEQLKAGKNVVPLLEANATKGANASGIVYGARRDIMPKQ